MTASLYSSTAFSADGITFIRTESNLAPTVGHDSLHCEEEKDNEYDKHVAAIIYDSFYSNKAMGHVPLYWSESADKFLKFRNRHIRVVAICKRVNRGFVSDMRYQLITFFMMIIELSNGLKNPWRNLSNEPMLKWKNA